VLKRIWNHWMVATHVEPVGLATIAERSNNITLPVKFFSSWTCPYSQRVWIGLEEKGADYQWVEVELLEGKKPRTLDQLSQLFPDFVACSPDGRLPALDNRAEYVFDSGVLLEYVQEAFPGPPLLPKSPYLRARVRLWAAHVDKHIVPHFDALLSSPEHSVRAESRRRLLDGLAAWETAMAPEEDGPFFLGDDFSLADIALAPWWQRMCTVLRAYRKFDPSARPRLQIWYEAILARPSFRNTVVDAERLIEQHADCADSASVDDLSDNRFRRKPMMRRGGGH